MRLSEAAAIESRRRRVLAHQLVRLYNLVLHWIRPSDYRVRARARERDDIRREQLGPLIVHSLILRRPCAESAVDLHRAGSPARRARQSMYRVSHFVFALLRAFSIKKNDSMHYCSTLSTIIIKWCRTVHEQKTHNNIGVVSK